MAIGAYSGVDTLAQSATTASEVARKEKEMLQAVQSQKKKMGKEFEAELKDAQERARRKAKKRGGLFDALRFAGMFLGPGGAAITGALSGFGQAAQQRNALKELMKGPQFDRFKGTFLGDVAEQQLQAAKDVQKSSSASLLSGLMGGVTGFAGGKLLGGEGFKSGFFEGVKGTPQAGAGSMFSGGMGGDGMNFANPSMRMGNLGRKATPFKTFIENVGKKLSP